MEAVLATGRRLYVTSAWGNLPVGHPIRSSMDLQICEPFALRLISLPASVGTVATENTQDNVADRLITGASIQEAPELPPVSSFSPERNVVDKLSLIRAEGPLDETLACFDAAAVELPFRRDSIEKVLEDSLRRGLTPNLQLCGHLAVSLGLHVMASRVPAAAGSRLQCHPCSPGRIRFGDC